MDGIICLEAAGGAGAAGTLHRSSREGKLPILAFDNDPETLDWIDRGAISATVTQKPCVMSYYGLKLLDDLRPNAADQYKDCRTATAAPMPTFVVTGTLVGTLVVDKSNLKVYRDARAAHPKPLESTYPARVVVSEPGCTGAVSHRASEARGLAGAEVRLKAETGAPTKSRRP